MGRTSNFPLLWESFAFWPCSSYFLNRFLMNKFLLSAPLCIVSFVSYAQQLSVKELLLFCGQDSQTTNDYLVTKGWTFNGVGKGVKTAASRLEANGSWKFKKSGYPDGIAANIQISQHSNGKREVIYITASKRYYDIAKQELFNFNAEKIYSWTEDDCLRSKYKALKNGVFVCNIGICKWTDFPAAYTIGVAYY